MVVLDCLGFLKKKNDSVKKTANDDEHGIVGYNLGYRTRQLSMIDVKSTRVRKVSGLEAERGVLFRMVNSCNGLIMFYFSVSGRYSVIFNPKSNNVVKRITLPVWIFHGGFPVGFFYHPLAKEYRTLNAITVGDNRYEYHIYLFGSDTWRAALNPYFHFTPSGQRLACTKQALYWCCKTEDKIVVFDIISEEFCMKPFPVCCMEKDLHTPPTLVAKDNEESLCCCYAHRAELSIDVWVLEDYANWSWNRKYVVDVNWCKTENYQYPEALRAFAKSAMGLVKVVSIQKDELVFFYQGDFDNYLYSYHLESGFSAKTLLSTTDWKIEVEGLRDEWYCGFIGL